MIIIIGHQKVKTTEPSLLGLAGMTATTEIKVIYLSEG